MSSDSPVPQDSCINQLISNQWKKFPESRLLARDHDSAHQEETSGLSRRIDPQDCSVTCVGADMRFPLTPVKMKESCGMVGMSSALSHPEWSPPVQGIQAGSSSPASSPHKQGTPKQSCWELHLLLSNAESGEILSRNFHAQRERLNFERIHNGME